MIDHLVQLGRSPSCSILFVLSGKFEKVTVSPWPMRQPCWRVKSLRGDKSENFPRTFRSRTFSKKSRLITFRVDRLQGKRCHKYTNIAANWFSTLPEFTKLLNERRLDDKLIKVRVAMASDTTETNRVSCSQSLVFFRTHQNKPLISWAKILLVLSQYSFNAISTFRSGRVVKRYMLRKITYSSSCKNNLPYYSSDSHGWLSSPKLQDVHSSTLRAGLTSHAWSTIHKRSLTWSEYSYNMISNSLGLLHLRPSNSLTFNLSSWQDPSGGWKAQE